MSHFLVAFHKTLGHEGGYVHDPHDPGGETYCGITMRDHPDWSGWALIRESFTPPSPEIQQQLEPHVADFYRRHYWDAFGGNDIAAISAEVAQELFDSGVNVGTRKANTWLQASLNVLRRAYSPRPYFDELVEDGKIGPVTVRAFEVIAENGDHHDVYKLLNIRQGQHYFDLAKEKPQPYQRYLRGWLDRVEVEKQ
mgnify:CR=1 FL=1